MTPKQEAALRDYLREAVVPLIEEVLVKKLGQAMTFAKEELTQPQRRIEELEALLERQTARIVDLQTHIENFEGEDR
jgi:hypothetical protein